MKALSGEDVEALIFPMLSNEQRRNLEQNWELDLSYGVHGIGRFRVNVYKDRGDDVAAFRSIKTDPPKSDELNLHPIVKELCHKPRGLILVTGPTGSGKSTTLAAMVDYINENRLNIF